MDKKVIDIGCGDLNLVKFDFKDYSGYDLLQRPH